MWLRQITAVPLSLVHTDSGTVRPFNRYYRNVTISSADRGVTEQGWDATLGITRSLLDFKQISGNDANFQQVHFSSFVTWLIKPSAYFYYCIHMRRWVAETATRIFTMPWTDNVIYVYIHILLIHFMTLHKVLLGNEVEDDTGGACSMHGR